MSKRTSFFVIDFDRTLGSVEAMTELLCRVVDEVVHDRELVVDLRHAIVASSQAGLSFDAYGYVLLRSNIDTVKRVMERFEELGKKDSRRLLEDGANKFLAWMNKTGRPYCIMSYGSPDWQTTKVRAAGLSGVPLLIVDSPDKVRVIHSWRDPTGAYDIKVTEVDTRQFTRIVLIDDKAKAFKGIDSSIRGYHVAKEPILPSQMGEVANEVMRVLNITDIITYESEEP